MINFLLSLPLISTFVLFFKFGIVFFGGGYAIIPVLHAELVTKLHLLTEQQFIDGTALSQLTPGPVAIIATFAGYMIEGIKGALIATLAMFLPGSLLMFVISKNYEKIKNSDFARKILNAIIPAVIGLLIATAYQLGQKNLTHKFDYIILPIALILISKYKLNPIILIIASAILGIFLHY